MPNPWKDFTPQRGNHLLQDDAPFVTTYNALLDVRTGRSKKEKSWEGFKFMLELFPEPFIGNKGAPVYILNANPGVPENIETEIPGNFSPAKLNTMADNLLHQGGGFYYFDPPFLHSGGYEWWKKKIFPAFNTNQLDAAQIQKVKDTFFCLELIGYHSRFFNRGFFDDVRREGIGWPPSMTYAVELVNQAMAEEKIILLMKAARFWFDLVPNLRRYPKCDIIGERKSSLMETYVSPWAMQQLYRLLQ